MNLSTEKISYLVFFVLLSAAAVFCGGITVSGNTKNEQSLSLPDSVERFLVSSGEKKTKNGTVGKVLQIVEVYFHGENEYRQMALEDYVTGVVLGEMPSGWNPEAYKAQAVAARTFALYKLTGGKKCSCGAVLCDCPGHCMAYCDYGEAEKTVPEKVRTVSSAVRETGGETVVYDGKLIEALFHSSSYRMTAGSDEVWGGSLPYLVPVETPEDPIVTEKEVGREELEEIFGVVITEAGAESAPGAVTAFSEMSGRSSGLVFDGFEIPAAEVRTALSLASANFRVEYNGENDSFQFTVYGKGHGVGMSQYGAQKMAENGAGYREILLHYYSGCEILCGGE